MKSNFKCDICKIGENIFLNANINNKPIPVFEPRRDILKNFSDVIINPKTREYPDGFTEETIEILDLENKYTGIALSPVNFLGIEFKPVCVCQESLPDKNCVMFVLKQDEYGSEEITRKLVEIINEPDWTLEYTEESETLLSIFALVNVNVSVTRNGYIVFDQYVPDIVATLMEKTGRGSFDLQTLSVFDESFSIGESIESVKNKLKGNEFNVTIDEDATYILCLNTVFFKHSVFFPRFSFLDNRLVSVELFFLPVIPSMDYDIAVGAEVINTIRQLREEETDTAFDIDGAAVLYSPDNKLYLYAPLCPVEEGIYMMIVTDKYVDCFQDSIPELILEYRNDDDENFD